MRLNNNNNNNNNNFIKILNSYRKIYICLLILLTFIIYLFWNLIVRNSADIKHRVSSDQHSVQLPEGDLLSSSLLAVCSEHFLDSRLYIRDKPQKAWQNLTMIYFVTPTYPRREQAAELIRLGYTLQHVPRIHWIVANDHTACSPFLTGLLYRFHIPFTHLASPMPARYRKEAYKPRGVANRRASLQWLHDNNITNGILYFGDDDNTYNLTLFDEIRDTKRVSMFPVGLVASYGVSGPVVRHGKVVGFLDSWVAGRKWPVDMAGFAVNLAYMALHPNASMPFKAGYEEDFFLRSISLTMNAIEPKANNCTEILVWHTQTKNHKLAIVKLNQEYLDGRSNLGALFNYLFEMGISQATNENGAEAIISKNGKAKPLSHFLS